MPNTLKQQNRDLQASTLAGAVLLIRARRSALVAVGNTLSLRSSWSDTNPYCPFRPPRRFAVSARCR